MAKSNRRKRQDRVMAGAKRAEQARRRAKAEREQQTAERYRQLLDPLTSPADVAGILAAELPDSLAAAAMMQIRLASGAPGEELAQTARLMLASATGPPPIGTLAVAAWAAHVAGDEDAERGYASELLSRARCRWFRIPGSRRSCFWRRSGEHPVAGVRGGPGTPGELAARASEWDRHVRFGIWQVQEPKGAPGAWCTELVSGLRRYAQFPAAALAGAAPWSTWRAGGVSGRAGFPGLVEAVGAGETDEYRR